MMTKTVRKATTGFEIKTRTMNNEGQDDENEDDEDNEEEEEEDNGQQTQ